MLWFWLRQSINVNINEFLLRNLKRNCSIQSEYVKSVFASFVVISGSLKSKCFLEDDMIWRLFSWMYWIFIFFCIFYDTQMKIAQLSLYGEGSLMIQGMFCFGELFLILPTLKMRKVSPFSMKMKVKVFDALYSQMMVLTLYFISNLIYYFN